MLDVRLARLALPLPLELSIRRALVHPERSTQHEGLVLAWELAARILAGSLWAACRAIDANSSALEAVAAKLDRPSLGHWVELERTCAALLRGRTEPAALAFRATLDGLEEPLSTSGGLQLLAGRIAALPAGSRAGRERPKPRRIQELLDALPFYRNEAQSTHGDVPPAFREDSVPALLEALVEFCERVPLLGNLSLVFVRKLERAAHGHVAEIARLSGNSVSWSTRTFEPALWSKLAPARPYLFGEPDLVLPLFPMAAVTSAGSEWHVGWYARQVHAPTVVYQGIAGQEFQLALAPDDLAAIVRNSRAGPDAPSADALRLDPYRGLLTYEEEHAAIFFGREEETEAALARVEERGALFVYGASGSGKSSWLRAGIVPALRTKAALTGRTLRPILVLPGDKPIASLRRALTSARGGSPEDAARWAAAVDEALSTPSARRASTSSNEENRALAHLLRGLAAQGDLPVLLVDQLEEAALAAIDREEGRAFLALVAGAAASAAEVGAIVLASARADLLAPLIEHEGLRRFLQTDGWPIGSIAPERLARVIVEPLRGRKVGVEPGLAETIVADVASEPGALALLSQVLTTLWTERERFGGGLTKQGYVDAGRVAGALEKQAEAALAEARAGAPGASTASASGASAAPTVGASGASASGASASPAPSASTSTTDKRVDRLFRALAQSDEGERFTRRRVKLASLATELSTSETEIRALAAPFVTRRLVVLGGDADAGQTVEVAHERLLDAWPRLRNLLASEREALELRREVEAASSAWESSGGTRELWTDGTSKLRRSEELVTAERLDLDARGRAFLGASRAGVRRRKRIERAALAAMVLLVLVAGGASLTANSAMRAADRSALAARLETTRADAKANEAEKLKDAALVRERELRIRGLIDDLAVFESLDDSLAYARKQDQPAHVWWIERARLLVEGQAEDPKSGKAWSPGLPDVEEQLAKVRARALPWTDIDKVADRKSHPRARERAPLRARLAWYARMLGLEPWPSGAEVEAELEAELSKEGSPELEAELSKEGSPEHADGLNEAARALVDPDEPVLGGESRALLLARRAVASASDAQRPLHRGTLAWALFRTGHLDEALTEERTAVEEITTLGAAGAADVGGLAASITANSALLEREVAAWRGASLSARHAEREQFEREVLELDRALDEQRTWRFERSEDDWWHAQLVAIAQGLRHLESRIPIAERSVASPEFAARWTAAIDAIARSEKYRGVRWPSGERLSPQIGLVPIGADPHSGLWEFAHLQSGDEPERGADGAPRRDAEGKLVLAAGTGLVFVLLPGGRVPVEEVREGLETIQQASLTRIDLDPFFQSKYEMTNAQWDRIGGGMRVRAGAREWRQSLLPVSEISWDDCTAALSRSLGWLWLPTEAQWEYACRAGTPTAWWTGDDPDLLVGSANIRHNEDDQTSTFPVGTLRANPFGLHDVHGNIGESCRDAYGDGPRQLGDGLFEDEEGDVTRVLRGGADWGDAAFARSSERNGSPPDGRNGGFGLRPARGITP